GTKFAPGTSFDKVWRMRSTGCKAWPSGTQLVFVSGNRMNGPKSANVPKTAKKDTVDIKVSLIAPSKPGKYVGFWQLQAPDGTRFGPRIFVEIVVVNP
ncbi:MAG TPA: hypothetical protein ENJ31_07625, partial [Anaerolineae bacterium]|nr:hypothetical protein [Anaerolineae bacterium]